MVDVRPFFNMPKTIPIIILALCALSCGSRFEPAPLDGLVLISIQVDGHVLSAWIPETAKIGPGSPDGKSITIRYHWGRRNDQPLTIAAPDNPRDFEHSLRLNSGARLNYTVISPTPPHGMGGREATLEGQLDFGFFSLLVNCHDQAPSGEPDPTWCIPFLHHIRPPAVPRSSITPKESPA